MVIGPVRLSGNRRGKAPSVLEHGGTALLQRRGQDKAVEIQPRPFMGPAFDKEKPKLPAMWRDSIK